MSTFKPKFLKPDTDDAISDSVSSEQQSSAFVFNAHHNLGLVEQVNNGESISGFW